MLLAGRVVPREASDLMSVIDHRRRRRTFQKHVETDGAPWEFQKPTETPSQERAPQISAADQAVMEARGKVQAAITAGNLDEAGDLYEKLIEMSPSQVLAQRPQLDLAMHLISAGRRETAANVMEQYLRAYPRAAGVEQVQLMLGITYARYLAQPDRAAELIRAALPGLKDFEQVELAKSTLRDLAG
jgi:hypothetical protein